MVTIYGLSPEVGHVSYYDSTGQSDYTFSKPYSEKTAEKIDSEIRRIIDEQYSRCVQLLTENKDKLTLLANKLLEEEVIFREDLEKIFGARLFDEELNSISKQAEIEDGKLTEVKDLPVDRNLKDNNGQQVYGS